MKAKLPEIFFFIILVLALSAFVYILYPYLGAISLALVLSIIFRPVNNQVHKILHGKDSLSAVITMLTAFILVIIPLYFISSQMFDQINQSRSNDWTFSGSLPQIEERIQRYIPNFQIDIESLKGQVLDWLSNNLQSLFSGIAKIGLDLIIFVFTLFYLLRDGHKFRAKLRELSPLPDSEDEEIIGKVEKTINSVVRGALLIAILQGFIAGLGFFIFGFSSYTLFGITAAFAAMIPGVGTSLVFIPTILFLALAGDYAQAIGLGIWAALAVGLIDNFLAPILYERGIKIHPLLIFLSVISGLSFFGPLGFILGPILLSLVFSLLHIYHGKRGAGNITPTLAN